MTEPNRNPGRIARLQALLLRELQIIGKAWLKTWPWMLVAFVISTVVVLILFQRDPEILASIRVGEGSANRVAHNLETFGRAEYGTVLLSVILFAIGWLTPWKRLRRAAVAALVAGLLAGILVNFLRPTIGRARPDREIANGIYGPSMEHEYHSLPSGHAMSNSATVAAVAFICPQLTVPAVLYSGAMAWSRMEMDDHHLSDVIAGTLLGWSVGIWIGYAVVRRRELMPPVAAT